MRGLRLGEATVWLLLRRVDQIGKFYRVLDEEHRDVVADDVPVALLGVELDGEAAHVAGKIRRALIAGDRGEPHEGFGLLSRPLKQVGLGNVGERFISFEEAMGAEASRMDDALWNAFMVEMEDLLAEVMVLEQGRTARSHFEGVLVVGDRGTLLRGEHGHVAAGDLVRLATSAAHEFSDRRAWRSSTRHSWSLP